MLWDCKGQDLNSHRTPCVGSRYVIDKEGLQPSWAEGLLFCSPLFPPPSKLSSHAAVRLSPYQTHLLPQSPVIFPFPVPFVFLFFLFPFSTGSGPPLLQIAEPQVCTACERPGPPHAAPVSRQVIELCRPLDSRLEHVDFESLFSCLSVRHLLCVFASLLLERRVIFIADKLRYHPWLLLLRCLSGGRLTPSGICGVGTAWDCRGSSSEEGV